MLKKAHRTASQHAAAGETVNNPPIYIPTHDLGQSHYQECMPSHDLTWHESLVWGVNYNILSDSCVPPFNEMMSCIILTEVIPQSETSSARGDDIV